MTEILLFARAPRRGAVKTRLAAEVGRDVALEVYRALGRRVAAQVAPAGRLTVWFDPPDAEAEMRNWVVASAYRPQVTGSLGARLAAAFHDHLTERPGSPTLAIGADAPGVDAQVIEHAARALTEADVVLGPSLDGGYYLLGVRDHRPGLFDDVPWGTDEVFSTTTAICDALALRTAVLPPLRDVDRLDDLRALAWGPLDRVS